MDIIKNVTSNIQNKEGLRVSNMFFICILVWTEAWRIVDFSSIVEERNLSENPLLYIDNYFLHQARCFYLKRIH